MKDIFLEILGVLLLCLLNGALVLCIVAAVLALLFALISFVWFTWPLLPVVMLLGLLCYVLKLDLYKRLLSDV